MDRTRIRSEDLVGLGLALLAHGALVAWLAWTRVPPPPPVSDKVMVTLSGDIADQASSTTREAAAPDVAPQLAEQSAPMPMPAAQPQAAATPLPKQAMAAASQHAAPSRVSSDFLKGVADNRTRASAKNGGASRIGDDFLKGVAGSDGRGKSQTPPGPVGSAQVRSSLVAEVSRQLKPHWQSPDGVDVDKLATTIEWDLNPDGTLAGAPRFVGQAGVNSANRAQADRHREQAIRAIRLSAPFRLPPQFYAGWQRMRFTFDWKLN